MDDKLKERLSERHSARFVGREPELNRLRTALDSEIAVVMMHGVAGVGKTTILREFQTRCSSASIGTLRIDARDVPATPDAVRSALMPTTLDEPKRVVQIDNYETFEPLDRWIRETLAPEIPAGTLLLLAGRKRPSAGWSSDPAWKGLFHAIRVENLGDEESSALLAGSALSEDQIREALAFTHGHPLALALVAELALKTKASKLNLARSTDVIQALVERFVEATPDEAHRRALEICALARVTTEALLAKAIPGADVFNIFRWLKELSFVELGPTGLSPHDLARTAIVADLKWRNPQRYGELHMATRRYYNDALAQLPADAQRGILFDYIYLHRENPVVAPAFQFDAESTYYADSLSSGDIDELVGMTRTHDGAEAAGLAKAYIEAQPENVVVIRSNLADSNKPAGYLILLAIDRLSRKETDRDPACRAAHEHLNRQGPLRPAERCTLFRFWMSGETYQDVSQCQSLIFVQMVHHSLTTPKLAMTFIPCRQPELWAPVFTYALLERVVDGDFVVDEKAFGMYAHDWRRLPPRLWLDILAKQEVVSNAEPSVPDRPSIQIFDRVEFSSAVRAALRDCLSTNKLRSNPLTSSRIIYERSQAGDEAFRTIQELLKEAAFPLRANEKDRKLFRALEACYFEPCSSQEEAAENLQIGVATLRRHLKEATERITDFLWAMETGG